MNNLYSDFKFINISKLKAFFNKDMIMRSLIGVIVMIGILTISACSKGKNNPKSCNGDSTRRDVKILVDSENNSIDTASIFINVSELGALEVPEVDKEDGRQEVEKHIYTITAKVHKLSKHRDGDWKVKLTDDQENYVNCEAPNMGCEYILDSPHFNQMKVAREWIEQHQDELEGKTVTVTGVGFIDIDHKYPRNAAPNEMELHPILKIEY